MNYEELSRSIERLAGGASNVASHTNCMTRLRLNVVDPAKVDVAGIKALDGVLGVVPGDQVQIVVGPGHAERLRQAYDRVSGQAGGAVVDANLDPELGTGSADLAAETRAKVKSHQTSAVQRMFRHIGNIFIPVIPGFIACGLVGAIANIWKSLDSTVTANPWFLAFAGLSSILVGALYLLVGHNTAKEFGGTPVLGFIAGGVAYMPALAGIPAVTAADGTVTTAAQPLTIPVFGDLAPGLGGIIGVIITAWLFTVIEKRVRAVVPAAFDLFLVPPITLLIGAALCIFIVMPISALLMKALTWLLVDFALKTGGIVGGFIMSTFFLPMVMLGIHQGLTPIHAQLITEHGFTELLPILAMGGAGQVGMAIAVWARTRNDKLKGVIKSALPIGILGIGEPLIYGVSLPLVRPFITACLGAGFGGAFIAWGMQQELFGAGALGLSGLLMIPVITTGKWLWYLGGWAIAVGMGAVLTYFFGYKESDAERVYGSGTAAEVLEPANPLAGAMAGSSSSK